MPLHLLPPPCHDPGLSRRAFLGRAAAAAAGVFVSSRFQGLPAAAGAAPDGVSTWALLSDTHIPADRSEKNGAHHMAANFERVVGEVLAARPDACMVNGDLARTLGTPGDYASFLELAGPLRAAGFPLHLTLGNHDDRRNFLASAAAITAAAGGGGGRNGATGALVEGKWASVAETGGRRWFFLDSLEKVNEVPGLLGPEQLRWLEQALDAAPATPAIFCVHHNVEATKIGLQDTEELLRVLRPRQQVKAVFFGHTHNWKRWEDEGIHMVNLPAVAYPFQAGTPIGWVRAEFAPGGMVLELRSLDPAHPDHGVRLDLRFREQRQRVRAL
jgi:predicted phosphodiesterase